MHRGHLQSYYPSKLHAMKCDTTIEGYGHRVSNSIVCRLITVTNGDQPAKSNFLTHSSLLILSLLCQPSYAIASHDFPQRLPFDQCTSQARDGSVLETSEQKTSSSNSANDDEGREVRKEEGRGDDERTAVTEVKIPWGCPNPCLT